MVMLRTDRMQEQDLAGVSHFRRVQEVQECNPEKMAIVVCDMWDAHHCLNAVRREAELVGPMNKMLEAARKKGMLIIHSPSSCMEPYKDFPGRKMAQAAPTAKNLPADIGAWCYKIPAEEQGTYPIDQTDGGEDDDPAEHAQWHKQLAAKGLNPKAPWKKQVAGLTIHDEDAISDSGVEIWNLLEARGINTVILCGVHTNMCVLGRPFGLRQLAKNGKNVILLRDMTDTMYNPARPPYVSHFAGTQLIIEHIEKYVCPTMTSADLFGGDPFQFSKDRHHILMIIDEDEYNTKETLVEFRNREFRPLGLSSRISPLVIPVGADSPSLAKLISRADLVLVSVRRRMAAPETIAALKSHVAAGKPLVGIRTASHAFEVRDEAKKKELLAQGLADWTTFDAEVLGGHYANHHEVGPKTAVTIAEKGTNHPILLGIKAEELVGSGSLYLTRPLAKSAVPLLIGTVPGHEPEPIAWTNLAGSKQARVFYTSLGHPTDFENPQFRKLLLSGIFWTLEPDYSDVKIGE